MFGIGMTELMVIFVIGLVILGPKRLPELARSLGRSLAEFRRASNEMRREFMDVAEEAKIEPPSLEPAPGAKAPAPGQPAAASAGEAPGQPAAASAGEAPGKSAAASAGDVPEPPSAATDAPRDG